MSYTQVGRPTSIIERIFFFFKFGINDPEKSHPRKTCVFKKKFGEFEESN